MSLIKPFEIAVPDAKLASLRRKLEDATFPDELEDVGWDLGAPLSDIKRLTGHWKDKFDWRAKERELNEELPQFTTDVDVEGFGAVELHFVHRKSKVEGAIPLLFIHGCKLNSRRQGVLDVRTDRCPKGPGVSWRSRSCFPCSPTTMQQRRLSTS